MPSCSVLSEGAGRGEQSRCWGERWASGGERVALCIPLLCILSLSVFLSLFASFAVLFNCPYPDPRVLPFSSHSPPTPAGGAVTEWPHGSLLLARAKPRQKPTVHRADGAPVTAIIFWLSLALFCSQQKYRHKATPSKQILMDTSLFFFFFVGGGNLGCFAFLKSYVILFIYFTFAVI